MRYKGLRLDAGGLVAVKHATGDLAINEDDHGITSAVPNRTDVQQFEHVSFSREQIAASSEP
ncbi:MAG TPA: hypothetical protein VF043_09370 [Ktedonobacteraceae bacterium]